MNAERIKLLSTRSPYWCIAIVVVFAIAIATIMGITVNGAIASTPEESAWTALIGINNIGVLVLMIMAVLAVTSEYRFGTIRISFQAIPVRSTVLLAKAAVFAFLSFAVTLVLSVLALALVRGFAGADSMIEFGDSGVIRQIWGTPILAALYVVIGLGVGAIVRQTAGAIVIVLIWNLAFESILSILPKVGEHIAPFLPFANGNRFLHGGATDTDYPWNEYGSLIYFAVFAAIVFAIGVVMTERRDA
ncbi:ABC transporter permease [Gordonia sp. CPCC 206044]|uniref:ABC transporter permease n=1 Tax=Gordonia sp. CPCC 206044 TaxID=3140793 RepID=UPI003AF3BA61